MLHFQGGVGKFTVLVRDPFTKVSWYKENKRITESESVLKYEQIRNGRLCELYIKNCTSNDISTYTVKYFNFQMSARLKMYHEPTVEIDHSRQPKVEKKDKPTDNLRKKLWKSDEWKFWNLPQDER